MAIGHVETLVGHECGILETTRTAWELPSQAEKSLGAALSLEEFPWEGLCRGAGLAVSVERGAGEIEPLIWGGVRGTGDVHLTLFRRVLVALVSFPWAFIWTLREMGVERVGKWTVKQWSRDALSTRTVPCGGFGQLPASGNLKLVFSGRPGGLVFGASLRTRLCSGLFGNSPEQHVWEHFQLCCQTQTQVTAFRLYRRETRRKLNVICPLHSRSLPDQTLLIRAVPRVPKGRCVLSAMPSKLWRLPGDGLAHAQGFLCQAGFTLAWSPALCCMAAVAMPGQRCMCIMVGGSRSAGQGHTGDREVISPSSEKLCAIAERAGP